MPRKISEERKKEIELELQRKQEIEEQFKEMVEASSKIKSENNVFTFFFNNAVMAKILDLLLNNPKTPIHTDHFIEKTDISRKSLYSNLLILTHFGIVEEIWSKNNKFFLLNTKNPITKHISKLIDIVSIENAKIESKNSR